MMVSKGTFCLLALFLLVKSSQQRASEEIQDLQHSSSQEVQDSFARSGLEDERSAQVDASAKSASMALRPRPPVPPSGLVQCIFEEQVINAIWGDDCYVCVCVRRWNSLEPVCGSCNQCANPSPPWTTIPPPPTPPPTLVPDVPKCDPLPTNKQFPNPLDPCQICICKQVPDAYGRLPAPIIECQMNPNCVPPSTSTPPNHENICKFYPNNVWFKNPNVPCELCTCTAEQSIYGPPQTHLNCYPDPNCEIPTTLFPPTTTVAPKKKDDPLGPRPHVSCLPFTPDVPFDHPWDPCQTCVCSEYYRPGLINIDVNCYTKRECCLEYLPTPQISTPRPYTIPIGSNGAGASAYSHSHADGSGSAIADSSAYVNSLSPYGSPGQSSVEANAYASANNNAYSYSPPMGPNGLPLAPGQGSGVNANANPSAVVNDDGSRIVFPGNRPGPLGPSGQNSASNANLNANIGGGLIYPGQYGPGQYGGGQSADTSASAFSNANSGGGGFGSGGLIYPIQYGPGQYGGGQSADSSASAFSNANSGGGGGLFNPGLYVPLAGQGSSETSASINANVNVGNNGMLLYPDQNQMWPGQYGVGGVNGFNSLAQADAQAQAMAAGQANLQSISPLLGSYNPGGYGQGGVGQALANANAHASGVGGNSEAAAQAYAALKSGGEEDESGSS